MLLKFSISLFRVMLSMSFSSMSNVCSSFVNLSFRTSKLGREDSIVIASSWVLKDILRFFKDGRVERDLAILEYYFVMIMLHLK
jgi:hypothetical protein